MNKFVAFLESIKNPNNSNLIEVFVDGLNAVNNLYESPDTVILPNSVNSLTWENSDAIPFIYLYKKNELVIDNNIMGGMHLDLITSVIKKDPGYDGNNYKEIQEKNGFTDKGTTAGLNGRAWLKNKIISFWHYPTEAVLKGEIIPAFKNKGININNDWKIEVFPEGEDDINSNSILIPIFDYKGKFMPDPKKQEELDKMRELHTMSPEEKKRELLTREVPAPKVDPGDKSMAEYNYLYNELRGD